LLQAEAVAAVNYWSQWQFSLKYHPRGWPSSWCNFDGRASAISHGPEHSTHPANSILNYVYSVAAGLCVRSLFAAGFDPGIGYLHLDREGRYSLAYDLLELLRADIDNSMLPWIASQKWRRADFPVTTTGIVRCHPNLVRVIMQRTAATITPALVDKAAAWLADTVVAEMQI
jgi:CRISPR-associated endonuclease Cas1